MRRNIYQVKEVAIGILLEIAFIVGVMGLFGSIMVVVMR